MSERRTARLAGSANRALARRVTRPRPADGSVDVHRGCARRREQPPERPLTDAGAEPTDVPSPGLAARYYLDDRVAAIEKEHVFARTWQLAVPRVGPDRGRRAGSWCRSPGARSWWSGPRTACAAHLNVCRHRGSRLITGPEPDGKAIRCPYHGWTYHLDGSLVGAPEGKSIPCLDRPSLGLFPAQVESFLGFVFVNLDRDADAAGRAARRHRRHGRPLPGPGPARRSASTGSTTPTPRCRTPTGRSIVDNYLEGYHVPVAHPGLMRLLDYQRYTVDHRRALRLLRGAAARQALGEPAGALLPAAGRRRCPAWPTATSGCGATWRSTRTR